MAAGDTCAVKIRGAAFEAFCPVGAMPAAEVAKGTDGVGQVTEKAFEARRPLTTPLAVMCCDPELAPAGTVTKAVKPPAASVSAVARVEVPLVESAKRILTCSKAP